MPQATPAEPGGPQAPGGIRHQLVWWLQHMSVLPPLLEPLHRRQVVSAAWVSVEGEETTIGESGRRVEVLALNRMLGPRALSRVGEWRQGRVLTQRLDVDPAPVNDARRGRLLDAPAGVSATIGPQLVARARSLGWVAGLGRSGGGVRRQYRVLC